VTQLSPAERPPSPSPSLSPSPVADQSGRIVVEDQGPACHRHRYRYRIGVGVGVATAIAAAAAIAAATASPSRRPATRPQGPRDCRRRLSQDRLLGTVSAVVQAF
jgi:hypothetical protein